MSGFKADPGSFRDPLSRVFVGHDAVYRAFTEMGKADLDEVWSKPFVEKWLKRGDLIATDFVSPASAPIEGDWATVMRHPKLPFISYPYEWTFSMLRDAALLQLKLTKTALKNGVGVKDATPYNVQFVGSKPVFIDAGSFEVRQPSDPWYGYLQFCQLYLYPLMLQAHLGVGFQPLLRGSVNGIDPVTMRKLLGAGKPWAPRRGRLTNVVFHAMAQQRFANSDVEIRKEASAAGMNPKILIATMEKLSKTIKKMSLNDKRSTWSEYSERGHYVESSLDEKERFVRDAVAIQHRSQVWDLGCNDGRFSHIASAHADSVVAADADPLVVDRLYQSLKSEKNTKISPLYIDLADSGGGVGWRGMERPGFFGRGSPEVVLYLAVIHHMAITHNVPLGSQIDMLAELTPELVIEFPHDDDPMVQRLLRNKRDGIHADYTLAVFENLLKARFDVRSSKLLDGGTRTIFHATRRG